MANPGRWNCAQLRKTARKLRDIFVIDDLFRPGEISMTYVRVDRGCDSQDSHKRRRAPARRKEIQFFGVTRDGELA
jgi:hypothetical protein